VKDVNVRNRVGGARVLYDQVIDLLMFALMEANPEIRLRQGAKIVADVGVFCGHIDENAAIWQLLDELVMMNPHRLAPNRLLTLLSMFLTMLLSPSSKIINMELTRWRLGIFVNGFSARNCSKARFKALFLR